jgi:hypothetical protein
MVCAVGDKGGRARWRASGDQAERKRLRRALLDEAKRAGVTVPRGLPDDKVRDLINAASYEPVGEYPLPVAPVPVVVEPAPAPARGPAPAPLSRGWHEQREAEFEQQHPLKEGPPRPGRPTLDEIRQAHVDAVRAQGGDATKWDGSPVMIAALRRHLPPGYAKAEVDAALVDMSSRGGNGVVLFPESNQKALLNVHRDGALRMGNQDKHLIWLTPYDLPGKPRTTLHAVWATYSKLAGEPGRPVRLSALRSALPDVSRDDMNTVLRWLTYNDQRVRLEPEPFRHRISAADREAALQLGGEPRHTILIGARLNQTGGA